MAKVLVIAEQRDGRLKKSTFELLAASASAGNETHAILLGDGVASLAGELAHYRLRLTPSKVVLEVPSRREAIAGEPVQKRLGALADALGRKGEILVG